jgi:HPt (histidine-containing phosphotransfer) domain-containing protein
VGVGEILIKVGADTAAAVSNLGKVDGALEKTQSTGSKMGAGLKKAALPAAAVLGALGVAAIGATKAALEDAAAQDKLAGVLERTTGATAAQVAATEDWISKQSMATGIADDELRPALAKLASATGSITKAQKELGVAMDVSAASGKSVAQTSAAIAKAHEGSMGALWKMVPGLKAATKGSKDMTVTMEALAKMTGGAMADSAATGAGQMKILAVQSAELQETLGAALIPVVSALLPILTRMGSLMAEHTGVIKVLIGVVAGLAAGILVANAAIKVYTVATQAWTAIQKVATAAQWLWNAALSANPIGLVIIAIAALGAAFVIAYKKSETFRDIVQGALGVVKGVVSSLGAAFERVKDLASAAWNWIASHWQTALFAFGPIGVAVSLIATHFDTVKRVAGDVANAVASAIRGITSAIESVIAAVQSLIGWLGRIHVPSINLPHIPGLSSVASSRTFAIAGATSSSSSSRAATPSSSGTTINVYGAVDPEGTARAIRRILADSNRRRGGI